MLVSGVTRIFKKEINGKELYSTTISNKNQEGQWERMLLSVQLPRNVVLEDSTDINITKGFLSFYKNREGKPVPKVVIQEFTTKEEQEERKAIQEADNYSQDFDNSLPF